MNQLLNILFVVSIIFTLGFSAYFGLKKQPKEMWTIIVAGSLVMAFCNIDRLVRFKAPGFEAEMREKIDEAYATLDHLRKLAVDVVEPLLTLLAMQNRMLQYIPQQSKIQIRNEIVQSLEQLEVSRSKIQEATKFFDAVLIQDHLRRLSNLASKSNEIEKSAKDSLKETADISSSDKLVNVDLNEISGLLGNSIEGNSEIREAFLDLEYYLTKRRLRRPEKWQ